MTLWMTLAVLGGLLSLLGLVGCVVPIIPGPILAYSSLWLLVLFGYPPTIKELLVGGAVVAFVTIIDYVLPSVCAKKFKCSRWGVVGCVVGSLVGLFFMPLGLILGPFLGTVAGELLAGKNIFASLKGGVGALIGYVLCLGLKLVAVGLFAVWFYYALPPMP